MNIKPIKNQQDYELAMVTIEKLWDESIWGQSKLSSTFGTYPKFTVSEKQKQVSGVRVNFRPLLAQIRNSL
jgi:hypothetical protein